VWRWLSSNDVVAAVTWIGTIAGGIGLALTYWQVRRARTAAEAASRAVRSLRRLNSVGHMAYSYSQIELIKRLVQDGQLAPAQSVFHSVKRSIVAGCQAAGNDQASRDRVEQATRNMVAVDLELAYGIDASERFSALTAVRALIGLGDFLSQLESELSGSEVEPAHEND